MGARPTLQLVAPTALDRIVGWLSPGRGLRRFHHRQLLSRAYAAALPGDTWKPRRPNASANADHAADAATLRAKSRSLIQNVEYIAAGMNARVAHIVGTGIVPTFSGKHGKKLQALFTAWSKVCDADGLRNYFAICEAAVRAMDADGEVLIRLRPRLPGDGLPVPLQLQLLEIDHLDVTKTSADNGNRVVNGREMTTLGKVVAFWIYPEHPGDSTVAWSRNRQASRRVPAEQVIHLFAPTRPGQGRGFPRLSSVIPRARDLQLLEDAELQRKNLEGRLSVLVSGDINSMTDHGQVPNVDGPKSLGELASGGITHIPSGMNATVVQPTASPGFVEYCKYNVHLVCAGAGFTYEQATGDMTAVNFSSARVRLLDFRREIEQLQWLTVIPQLCQRICDEFANYAYLGGQLAEQPIYTVEHSTPKWEHVNPAQDVQADLDEIAGGLSTFSEKLRRRGYDPKQVFDELESDIKGLQKRGIWDALVMLLKGKPVGASSPANPAAGG